jgi:YggT family protein
MSFFVSFVDIYIVILLLRFLIKPNEAYFDPVYRLIYRLTDPVIKAFAALVQGALWPVVLSVLAMVLLRGAIYGLAGALPLATGVGMSFLDFFQLLFRVYMAVWFIVVLSQWGQGGSSLAILDRIFHPFNRLSWRFRIRRNRYPLFVLLMLFVLYVLSSGFTRFAFLEGTLSSIASFGGVLEALMLVLSLFPFPGFFSLIIVVSALMSWVSPDPSNSIVRAIYGISEPLLHPFRRFIPPIAGLDISPILALLCFQVIGGLGQQLVLGLMKA